MYSYFTAPNIEHDRIKYQVLFVWKHRWAVELEGMNTLKWMRN